MTCKHYLNCRHYCVVTESCDYLLNTGRRRPHKAALCPGYEKPVVRRVTGLFLPNSIIFDRNSGEVRGRVHV